MEPDKKTKLPKIHRKWTINPSTRVKESTKNYNRAKSVRDWKKELDDGKRRVR